MALPFSRRKGKLLLSELAARGPNPQIDSPSALRGAKTPGRPFPILRVGAYG